MQDVVIVAATRTAIGSFQGALANVPAVELGATVIRALLEKTGIDPAQVDEVILGHVLTAGAGQNTARQASIKAGLPHAVPAMTLNKVCGSGMKAIMLAHDLISVGSAEVVVAGGMESMTNAPHLLNGSRTGIRYGSAEFLDHMAWDGLTDPYQKQSMGLFGEMCSAEYGFSREDQDAFAAESVRRALAAQTSGAFAAEIAPVTVSGRKGDTIVDADEEPGRCNIEKIPTLRAAFKKDGTLTAASSSSISDGAAATVIMSMSTAERLGATPLARIVGHASHAQAPEWFTTAPVEAIRKVLDKVGWTVADVDLFEVNEAFACVAMTPLKVHGISHDRLNVHGGACALGHPIGASGARIVVTLLNAMAIKGAKRGIAAICIGGGEATAIAVERL